MNLTDCARLQKWHGAGLCRNPGVSGRSGAERERTAAVSPKTLSSTFSLLRFSTRAPLTHCSSRTRTYTRTHTHTHTATAALFLFPLLTLTPKPVAGYRHSISAAPVDKRNFGSHLHAECYFGAGGELTNSEKARLPPVSDRLLPSASGLPPSLPLFLSISLARSLRAHTYARVKTHAIRLRQMSKKKKRKEK